MSVYCLVVCTLSFLALLFALISDFKHQLKAQQVNNSGSSDRKLFKNVYDMETLSKKYALLHSYCERFNNSAIHSAEVKRAIGHDEQATHITSPVVLSKHVPPSQDISAESTVAQPSIQRNASSNHPNKKSLNDKRSDGTRRNSK